LILRRLKKKTAHELLNIWTIDVKQACILYLALSERHLLICRKIYVKSLFARSLSIYDKEMITYFTYIVEN
jgi:hypothetical protein